MPLTHEFMLARMYASDKTMNGQFLTGVLSTGIYCLPSCPARKPKPENVRFFTTEPDARTAGLRPCLRCRPDDYYRDYDPDTQALAALDARIQREPDAFAGVEAIVAASGMGASKLHALFRQQYHATPAARLNRARLDAACRLLAADSARSRTVLDIAFAVGYESLSAFNENFRRATGLRPTEYRRLGKRADFTLALPPGYRSEFVLRLHRRDPNSVLERVEGGKLTKTFTHDARVGWLEMEFCDEQVYVGVSSRPVPDATTMRAAHSLAGRLLGLASDPAPFERKLAENPALAPLLGTRRGLRIPQTADTYEGLTWAILGQQVNLPFAYTLRRSLAELCGATAENGLRAHPTPAQVAGLDYADLTTRQYSRRKAEYLIDTSRRIVAGELPLERLAEMPAPQAEKILLAERGLGPWSANYVMMRACGFADCVPVGDSGLRAALRQFFAREHSPAAAQTLALMAPFAPYRSLAAYHLWMTLGDPA